MWPQPPARPLKLCRVSGGIFLLRGDDELVEMSETPYEAEDVLQEVYVTVWRRADRFDGSRASVMTWVSTIARNRSLCLTA